MIDLGSFLQTKEDWIIERLLTYAKRQDYTKYTSTLEEAWRMSIQELTNSIIALTKLMDGPMEFHPDDDLRNNPVTAFGILEAQKHRERGITLQMFLGLMKYYRKSYIESVLESDLNLETKTQFRDIILSFYDALEISYSTEWASFSEENQVIKLQETNRRITNEKNKFLTIFESIPDPILLYNEENKLTLMNFASLKLFNISETPGGIYYSEQKDHMKIPDWIEKEINSYLNFDSNIKNFLIEVDGTDFEVKLTRMLDVSDKFRGTIVIFDDVSVHSALKNKSNEMEEFVYTISHDLKNPIFSIEGFVMLIESEFKDQINDEIVHYLARIKKNTAQMQQIIMEILDYSKIGRAEEEKDYYSLSELINQVVSSFLPRIKADNIVVLVDEGFPTIYASKNRIIQLFENLIDNSIKYMDPESKIKQIAIKLVENTDKICKIAVRDTGIGIKEDYLPRLFQLFTRIPNKLTATVPGTGIGLANVKKIIETCGGEISVKSKEGKGTTFTFTLPLIEKS